MWEDGDHLKAIQIWAEYVLPSASNDYWRVFTSRLAKVSFFFFFPFIYFFLKKPKFLFFFS